MVGAGAARHRELKQKRPLIAQGPCGETKLSLSDRFRLVLKQFTGKALGGRLL